ncbi:MAG: hypothetical protein M3A44_01845 [Gammaproteobacteria bacterium]
MNAYTEDTLVQQTSSDYLEQQLCWKLLAAYIKPRLSISPKTVRPKPVEGSFMVRQAHHERRCALYFT